MLKIQNLSYKNVLSKITLDFKPGQIHAIIGRNGVGKTTLFKTLKCIWAPTSGEIYLNDQNLSDLSTVELSKLISLVPQNPPLFFHFTVKEFVEMGSYPNKRDATAILTMLELDSLKDKSILEISGGERKRTYIARSLLSDAPVILLDEPLSSLDPGHQWTIWKILKRLANEGKTILITLHDFEAAAKHADTVTLLSCGAVHSKGTPEEVITEKNLREVFALNFC